MPRAPEPANRSATCMPSTPPRLNRMSNTASRTRSEVGRTAGPPAPSAPAAELPPITRTPQPTGTASNPPGPAVAVRPGWTGSAAGDQLLNRNSASVVVDEETELVDQQVVVGQVRDLRRPALRPWSRASATRCRSDTSLASSEIAATLLPGPEDGALAPQLEVDLGQLETVGGPLHGRQAGRRPRGCRSPTAGSTTTGRSPGPPGPATGGAGRSRTGRRPR